MSVGPSFRHHQTEKGGEGARAVEGGREREQGRAASAIQERWRNYRRRRREEEAMRQEGRSEMTVEEDEEEEEVEVDREDVMRGEVVVEEAAEEVDRCSPSSFCCTRFLITKIMLSLMDAEMKNCHFQVKQDCISAC